MKKIKQINPNVEELLISNIKQFIKSVYDKKISVLNIILGIGSYLIYKYII